MIKPRKIAINQTKTPPFFCGNSAEDKSDLMASGQNPYFILEPGYFLELKGKNATLTITVLDETKDVDGVKTRVIEERETKRGKVAEISRNYYAISKKNEECLLLWRGHRGI